MISQGIVEALNMKREAGHRQSSILTLGRDAQHIDALRSNENAIAPKP